MSEGEFNAGEVRLKDEHTLERTNNHVSWALSFLNNDKISHAEVLAIKSAFVRALSDNGLDEAAINNVRRTLGLAPAGVVDKDIARRSVTPLTRQQIREILDTYAETINNNNNGDAVVRTSGEIYQGGQMSAENAAKRDRVNAALSDDNRYVSTNKGILRFQNVVAGFVDFHPSNREQFLQIAKRLRADLMAGCQNNPRADHPATARMTLSTGQVVEMATGMNEVDFAARLEDIIIRMRADVQPGERKLAAYKGYSKLKGAEKGALFDALAAGQRGGAPAARAIAVRLLYAFGITDHETLSVVNRINGDDAVALARQLAGLPAGTTAVEVRQNAVLIELLAKDAAAVVPEDQVYVPATSREIFNRIALQDIASNPPDILPSFRPIMDEYAVADGDARRLLALGLGVSQDTIALCGTDSLSTLAAVEVFKAVGGADRAFAKGYYAKEIPMLAKAFVMHRADTGCSVDDALEVAFDPKSKARRLVEYGDRFTESLESFRLGLGLIDRFRAWYTEVTDALKTGDKSSPTKLNALSQYVMQEGCPSVERFVFEELAHNPNADLNDADPENIFGMANNKAMRFIGRGFASSISWTLVALPPERRNLLFDVFDLIEGPLPMDQAQRQARQGIVDNKFLAMRVFRHFDEVVALRDAGTLDRAHLVRLLYADLEVSDDATNRDIAKKLNKVIFRDPVKAGAIASLFDGTGASVEECFNATLPGGWIPDPPPMVVPFEGRFENLEGFDGSMRAQLIIDLPRPSGSQSVATNKNVITEENNKFTFHFPDNVTLCSVTNIENGNDPAAVGAANAIADKVEEFCGKVHLRQIASVFLALSQSAMGNLRADPFLSRGYTSSEHMPITFDLTKDDETGAITIRYSKPEGFPIDFHWTTTIQVDGSASTTPLIIDEPGPVGQEDVVA